MENLALTLLGSLVGLMAAGAAVAFKGDSIQKWLTDAQAYLDQHFGAGRSDREHKSAR